MIRDLGVQLYSLREDSERDFPGVLEFVADTGYKAVEPENVDTLIVELDCCVIDMREALKQSYAYLTENRLGVGNK